MSENNVQNEQELWDVLSESVTPEAKAEPARKAAPKSKEGRFAKPGPMKEVSPAPMQEGRKLDGFFFACMAGVAAVSVAATLVLGGMLGGEKTPGGQPVYGGAEVPSDSVVQELELQLEGLKQENAELRAHVELQKEQIKDLQADLLDLTAGSAELPTMSTDPNEQDELAAAQIEAYEIFNQIKDAYADFDRAALEELIPEMDKRIAYLSSDAMNEYYLILEYVEMPSNG